MALSWLLLASLCVGVVFSFNTGPPAEISTCANLIPASRSPHSLQEGNGTYDLSVTGPGLSLSGSYFTYTAGQQYTGTISAASGNAILGFLVQAWNPADVRIGTFATGAGQQNLDCSSVNSVPAAATLVHSQRNMNPTVNFTWTAPSGSNGLVDFRYTIVREQPMFFGPLSAASSDGSIQAATVMMPTDSNTVSTQDEQSSTGTDSPNNPDTAAPTQDEQSSAETDSPNNPDTAAPTLAGTEGSNPNTTAGAVGFSASLLFSFFVAVVITDVFMTL